jgi:acyl-CoA dehydrogenase
MLAPGGTKAKIQEKSLTVLGGRRYINSQGEIQIRIANNKITYGRPAYAWASQSSTGAIMYDQLPDELIQLRDTLTRFVDNVVLPLSAQIEEDNEVPKEILEQGANLGLFGFSIPEEYGGLGESEMMSCVALETLSRGPGGVTFFLAPSAPAAAIRFAGSEAQRKKYLPRLASGETFSAFCLSEAGAGSDAAGIKTRAVRRGDKWVVNGSKLWISRATKAGIFLVSAVTDPEKRGKGGITVFITDKKPGIVVGKADRQMGGRGSGSAEVSFQDCEFSDDDVLGTVGGGFEVLKFILGRARLWAAARAVGVQQRALEVVLEHTKTREQFGKTLGEFQAIKMKIADMTADLYASRLLLYRAAHLFDQGLDPAQEVAIAKLIATEAAGRSADMAIQIHGAMGVSQDYHVERIYRDSRAYRILDGTSDIQRLMISSAVQRGGIGEAMAPGGLL